MGTLMSGHRRRIHDYVVRPTETKPKLAPKLQRRIEINKDSFR